MKEMCEFRVVEEFASRLFTSCEGKKLGDSIRKVVVSTDDPRFQTVGRLQSEVLAECGRSFFHGWLLRRRYTKTELAKATIFRLRTNSIFEPAGEECGTTYDEETACPRCGAGAKQTSPLFLNVGRIPQRYDINQTIAGEIVVSKRILDLFAQHGITGAKFMPVRSRPLSSSESKCWFQLNILSITAELIPPTWVGVNPFDDDKMNLYRCSRGDLMGLNLLSEVTISSSSRCNADIVCSRQFIGVRRGLLRPERIILISPKVRQLFEEEKVKGAEFEIAHLA